MIASKLEQVPNWPHPISDSQVTLSLSLSLSHSMKTNIACIAVFTGEDKPHVFIPLDIDRPADGKLMGNHHIMPGLPNGRLPVPGNLIPHASVVLPPQISQHSQPHTTASVPFMLDGGVYQGQPPAKPANEASTTAKVGDLSTRRTCSDRTLFI